MPAAAVLSVKANGLTYSLNVTRVGGAAATIYTDAAQTTAATFPTTISADTDFYVLTPTALVISAKLNNQEIASGSGGTVTIRLAGGNTHVFSPALDNTEIAATVALILTGTGSPASAVSAPVGTLYLRSDGGTSTTLYVKETGTGNTGWVAK